LRPLKVDPDQFSCTLLWEDAFNCNESGLGCELTRLCHRSAVKRRAVMIVIAAAPAAPAAAAVAVSRSSECM
jgi:hypothetical protein